MAIKQIGKLAIITCSLALSTYSMANGPRPSNSGFYGGVGLGGAIYTGGDYPIDFSGLTVSGTVGYEDSGWSIEGKVARAKEIDGTSDNIQSIAGAYRSIEKNGRYLKIKVGKQNFGDELLDDVFGDETVIGLGVGFRTSREERVELEYEYVSFSVNASNLEFPVHMFSVNYLFGGPNYSSSTFTPDNPIYAGVSLGAYDPDAGEFDPAIAYGFLLGYELRTISPGLGLELQVNLTGSADSTVDDPLTPQIEQDEYKSSSYALYLVYRTPGTYYIKGSLGYQNIREQDTLIEDGIVIDTDDYSDSAASYGIGAGYRFKDGTQAELNYVITPFDVDGFKWTPAHITFSYIF